MPDSVPRQTLPRAVILRRRSTFDLVRNNGRRVSNRWMALNFRAKGVDPKEGATVAFLTPKRLGAATVRNRLRRQMREVYRRHLAQVPADTYLVWIARPPALELPWVELTKCMSTLLSRRKP